MVLQNHPNGADGVKCSFYEFTLFDKILLFEPVILDLVRWLLPSCANTTYVPY